MSNIHCCSMMKNNVENQCTNGCECRMNCPDCLIIYNDGEYGIIIKDGTHSYIKISYCPWCGKELL